MMHKCPYCGGPMEYVPTIEMSERKKRIYEACVRAGVKGVTIKTLISHMVGPDKKTPPSAYGQLRVNVHEINKILYGNGQRIRSLRYGRYHLFKTGEAQ